MARLRIVSSADQASVGRLVEVGDRPVVIGREPGCELCLNDPGASRRHATLRASAEGITIEDLGGNNGTWVNAARVKTSVLCAGDRFRVGNTDFVVEGEAPAASPAPHVPASGPPVSPAPRKIGRLPIVAAGLALALVVAAVVVVVVRRSPTEGKPAGATGAAPVAQEGVNAAAPVNPGEPCRRYEHPGKAYTLDLPAGWRLHAAAVSPRLDALAPEDQSLMVFASREGEAGDQLEPMLQKAFVEHKHRAAQRMTVAGAPGVRVMVFDRLARRSYWHHAFTVAGRTQLVTLTVRSASALAEPPETLKAVLASLALRVKP